MHSSSDTDLSLKKNWLIMAVDVVNEFQQGHSVLNDTSLKDWQNVFLAKCLHTTLTLVKL